MMFLVLNVVHVPTISLVKIDTGHWLEAGAPSLRPRIVAMLLLRPGVFSRLALCTALM